MTADDPILSLRDVAFGWPGKGGFHLNIPAFDMAAGERVLMLGASGSGKSTLLSLICGTVSPARGQVLLRGKDMAGLRPAARDRLRVEEIGVIFQQFNLLPFGSVIDNIVLPLHFAPLRRSRVADPRAEAARLCAALGLPDRVLSGRASDLSVGQQQRVAAARALIGSPPLILADEPTSALDADTQTAFLDLLFERARASGAAVLMVSHDARLAAQFDRSVAINDIAARVETA